MLGCIGNTAASSVLGASQADARFLLRFKASPFGFGNDCYITCVSIYIREYRCIRVRVFKGPNCVTLHTFSTPLSSFLLPLSLSLPPTDPSFILLLLPSSKRYIPRRRRGRKKISFLGKAYKNSFPRRYFLFLSLFGESLWALFVVCFVLMHQPKWAKTV